MTVFRHSLVAGVLLGSVWLTPASGCGLHGSIAGGFRISYPGALHIAMAVAEARQDGILPGVNRSGLQRNSQFEQILADLEEVQLRLDAKRRSLVDTEPMAFSPVLVDPGLWSHYHLAPTAVETHYHAPGPIDGNTVVMTHHSVLRALLLQSITVEQATEFGLIEYSGHNASLVREAFEAGFKLSL